MKSIKTLSENTKYKALFSDMTPMECILICIPFTMSIISIPSTISSLIIGESSNNIFAYVFTALVFIFGLGILFLLGIRWRIIYFGILLGLGVFLIVFLGKPLEYYPTSDRDSAIRVGIEAILNGEFPYYSKTDLGNAISPLPFTFISYLPVYLITGGHTFFMNIIILCLFCIVLFYNCVDSEKSNLVLPIISFIILSDWFLLETAINSDALNSGLILCMILFLLPDKLPKQKKILKYLSIVPEKPKRIDKKIIIFTIAFGCLLAMRTYIWLIGIVVFFYILKTYGFKNSMFLGLLSICIFLAWILPFMLQDINYFLNVCPMGINSSKFTEWRPYDSIHPIGYFILYLLNTFLTFGATNSIIITVFIVLFSLLLGLIKLENKLHLLLIMTFCYLIFLFFYLFGIFYSIIGDYVSIAVIPFIFAFLYCDMETKSKEKKLNQ